MAYGHSVGLLPQEAPVLIAEKLKPFSPVSENITIWGVNLN